MKKQKQLEEINSNTQSVKALISSIATTTKHINDLNISIEEMKSLIDIFSYEIKKRREKNGKEKERKRVK
jgi:prefoldin subunit 5